MADELDKRVSELDKQLTKAAKTLEDNVKLEGERNRAIASSTSEQKESFKNLINDLKEVRPETAKIVADFKSAGLTDKLANFYTITLKEIADSTEVNVLSLYTKEDNKISISNDVLNLINNTLPNSVRFQNSVNTTSDKYVRLLIGA